MLKRYKEIKDFEKIVTGYGGCIASDKITVDGLPVMFMYREKPIDPVDSGWRFLSGTESDEFMADPSNHNVFDVNTIANYDPTIVIFLDAPIGAAFEKKTSESQFEKVEEE
jgi:hypothetical protein